MSTKIRVFFQDTVYKSYIVKQSKKIRPHTVHVHAHLFCNVTFSIFWPFYAASVTNRNYANKSEDMQKKNATVSLSAE